MRKINDFKPFIPSNDFDVSKSFYECMGFKINWSSEDLCEVDTSFGYRFLLQSGNHKNYSESLMLHFMVNSAKEWYEHFSNVGLVNKFPGTKVSEPELMPWGLIVTHVWDPAGTLLHFAEEPNVV
ncbi:hypothetical protein A9Q81_06755 [Gammaproteobacteria bacterium 42_54_T18]|nr:hypothetical protein A9Q81_06755 [Gammaproteobacteria bacterium 42_54_T18]